MTNVVESIRDIPEGGWGIYNGEWCVRPPGCRVAARITQHRVTEHEDGTITVLPSILYDGGGRGENYHGWLTRGIWTKA